MDHSAQSDKIVDRALELQREMASKVIRCDAVKDIQLVAGTDVAYDDKTNTLVAAVAVLEANTYDVLEVSTWQGVAEFPYIPGLFSFRELPPLLKAFKNLKCQPDLVTCDAHGIAHPRRFGLASHLGVSLDIPTLGCAKNILIGSHGQLGQKRGSVSMLRDNNEIIGAAVRTQTGVRPVYVSTGHRVSLKTCCNWVLKLSPRFRLLETTRIADQTVKLVLKKNIAAINWRG